MRFFQSRFQPWIEFERIVEKDAALKIVAHVLPSDQRGDVVFEIALVTLMRIIRRPENDIGPDRFRGERQRRLFDLGGEEDIAAAEIFAGLFLAARRVLPLALKLLVSRPSLLFSR